MNSVPREVIWKEVVVFSRFGHGVEIYHHWVPSTPVAFVIGFAWLHKPGTPATVSILKLTHSFPRKVVKRVLTEEEANGSPSSYRDPHPESMDGAFLAQDRLEEWATIVKEVQEAVHLILGDLKNGCVTERVSCWING